MTGFLSNGILQVRGAYGRSGVGMKKDTTAYSAERPAWDRNDCSVRALAVATGVPYAVASVVFSTLGRRIKAGTETTLSIR